MPAQKTPTTTASEKPVKAATTFLLDFDNLTSKAPAVKALVKAFKRAGATPLVDAVASDGKVKRTSGISYKELLIPFADSQQVTLRVKSTGDIAQILLNNSLVPIKNQGDMERAVAEIEALMNKGREAFQKKLAKAKIELPPAMKSTTPRQEVALTEKRDALKVAIAAVEAEIEALNNGST